MTGYTETGDRLYKDRISICFNGNEFLLYKQEMREVAWTR